MLSSLLNFVLFVWLTEIIKPVIKLNCQNKFISFSCSNLQAYLYTTGNSQLYCYSLDTWNLITIILKVLVVILGVSQVVLVIKNPPVKARDVSNANSIPGSGRSPEEDPLATPIQYSCLENPIDWGAWQSMVHGVTKSWTRLKQLITVVIKGYWDSV